MAWQIFGTLSAGNQPLSLFDTLTGQIAQSVIVPTTASGTNAIALALNANAPTITSNVNFQQFSFVAANNSTGSVTVNVNAIGALPLYKPGGIQAGSGDISSGVLYVIAFNQALNSGGGGYQIVSATPATLSLPVTVANGGTGVTSFATPWGVICAGTTTAGNLQVVAALGAAGQVLTSNGASALPTFQGGSSAGTLVATNVYSSSQTITIPSGATKLLVYLVGGGGGASTPGANSANAGSGGGCGISFYTGWTAGNTVVLTVGAGGTTAGTNGGTTTLASGTQTITSSTAGGGGGNGAGAGGGGGNLLNCNGSNGVGIVVGAAPCGVNSPIAAFGGMSGFGFGPTTAVGTTSQQAGQNGAGGAASGSGSGAVGGGGFMWAFWFS